MTASVETGPACPRCGSSTHPGDQFCESCGAPLTATAADTMVAAVEEPRTHLLPAPGAGSAATEPSPPPAVAARACASCGGEIDADGYCTICGSKAASERDHWAENPAPWVAGVCDRGIRHARNEDAMALSAELTAGSFAALVVCDGVTTATASDVASLAASRAARDALAAGAPGRPTTTGASVVHWTSQLELAATAANEQATAVAAGIDPSLEPPSCTFVAAVVDGPSVVTACIGDSRAYWLPDDGVGVQLTTDDSWAADQMALGTGRAEAEADARSHAITRWLGIDAPDIRPRCASASLDAPGWLLVCSDGLWNHASSPAALRQVIDEAVSAGHTEPAGVAAALVDFANAGGGQDNITAALARVPGPAARP